MNITRLRAGRRWQRGTKRVICALAFALLGSACRARDTGQAQPGKESCAPAQVLVDQSLDQLSSPYEVSFEGLSDFTELLRRNGFLVSVNNLPLEEALGRFSGRGDVLLLGVPWQRKYSAAALHAIRRFRDRGGGVLVISEHDDIYGNAEAQNALTEGSGIKTLPVAAIERNNPGGARAALWPIASAPRWGFENVRVYLPAPLLVSAPAEPLLTLRAPKQSEHSVVAALATERRGVLAVVADLEILWNMTPAVGIHWGDNERFMLKLLVVLAGRESCAATTAPPKSSPATSASKLAVFHTEGGAASPDGSRNGLRQFEAFLKAEGFGVHLGAREAAAEMPALAVLAVPLKPISDADALLRARKLLLIADGRTELLEAEPRIRPDGYTGPADYPLNRFAALTGISFPSATVLGSDRSMRAVGAWARDGALFPLMRAGSVAIDSSRGNFRIAASAVEGSILTQNLIAPLVSDSSGSHVAARKAEGDPGQLIPIVVHNDRIMVVTEFELLSDQGLAAPHGPRTLECVRRWLHGDSC